MNTEALIQQMTGVVPRADHAFTGRFENLKTAFGQFDVVLTDPPWPYYGSTEKDAAAGKHYDLMTMEDICAMPVRQLLGKDGACFVWATCPKLDLAVDAIRAWGLHYRGVAFTWQKTRRSDGEPIGAQGVPPTTTKPTMELVLAATTCKKGRPFPLLDASVRQDVYEPRTDTHSEKPEEVRKRIERLYGAPPQRRCIELFARTAVEGWARWGNEAPL